MEVYMMKKSLKQMLGGMTAFLLVFGFMASTPVYAEEAETTLVTTETSALESTPEASTGKITMTLSHDKERTLTLVLEGISEETVPAKENFEVMGFYSDKYVDFQRAWDIQRVTYDAEKNTVVIVLQDYFANLFTYSVKYVDASGEEKTVLAESSFKYLKNEPKQEESKKTGVVLKNQEAIHIPAGATLPDGTAVSNICDVAALAFSWMTTDGETVVPTYNGNKTGISEICAVKYRAIEGASSVIVRSVYMKVYLDVNNDGWVSAAEKAEDALGYYCIEVEVDKTLTVEDWSIVAK